MWYTYDGGHFWGMHFLWWIFWLFVIIWIIATPWYIPGKHRKRDTPLDILKKRYARGEINKEEFEERKKVLEQK